jgi:uncharacterized protein YigE (DUF2233 family)
MSMKKNQILAVVLLLTVHAANGQFQEKKNMLYKNAGYTVFKIRVDTGNLKNFSITENWGKLNETDFFARVGCNLPIYFAITAGIVDSACSPLGLFIKERKVNKPVNTDAAGNGNFYLFPPNGYFAIGDSTAVVAASTSYNPGMSYSMAVQSGPMLVLDGNINKFPKDSKNKNIRCGVGISVSKAGTYLVFAKSLSPVTFYQFASLFIDKFDCRNALNLESGTNCSMHLPGIAVPYRTNVAVCNYLVLEL